MHVGTAVIKDRSSLIADSLHGSIMLSQFEKDVMVTTLFNRLHGIYQNSTAYLTFPANRTRRIEHSIGCMYLCGSIFYSGICNAQEEILKPFFEQAKVELQQIINEVCKSDYGRKYSCKLGGIFKKVSREYDELEISGGIYNFNLPANIGEENRKIYIILFESIRIAAMLHDIGHPPFSHISENALNILYKRISEKENKNKEEKEFLDILHDLVGSGHQLHEELGNEIAEMLLMTAIPDFSEDDVKDKVSYQKQIFKILVKEVAMRILQEKSQFLKDLHSIIDGTLDGDRLDYVSRDPANSGFKLGITEYDRLISKMKLCEKENRFLICPSVSVVKTVEDFLMRRWNLYKNIIFHHRVIKTDCMLQNTIVEIAEEYFVDEANEKTGETDSYILPYDISGLWKANRKLPSDKEAAYAISQWDDTWLLTILKKSYFETYIDQDSYLHDQLEEFLTNKKNYYSLIKRKEEFEEIDTCVSQILIERKEELENQIEKLRELEKEQEESKMLVDIEGYLKGIKDILIIANENQAKSFVKRGGFILCAIKQKLFGVDSFSDVLEQMRINLEFEEGELFYAEKQPKTGTEKDLFFYQKTDELISLDNISNISNVLKDDLKYSPFFFLYIDSKSKRVSDKNTMRKKVGKSLGNAIVDFVLNKLGSFTNES